jgi:DNA repair protein RecO (recombination protein O)
MALALRGRALFSALYVNELLCRAVPHEDPLPELFDDYEAVLARLATPAPLDIVLREFELRLLDALGYGMSLALDAGSGDAIDPDDHYYFDTQRGLLPAYGRSDVAVFRGRDLLDFDAGHYSAEARRALKTLCRLALRPHLGDQPLRSRLLFATDR